MFTNDMVVVDTVEMLEIDSIVLEAGVVFGTRPESVAVAVVPERIVSLVLLVGVVMLGALPPPVTGSATALAHPRSTPYGAHRPVAQAQVAEGRKCQECLIRFSKVVLAHLLDQDQCMLMIWQA